MSSNASKTNLLLNLHSGTISSKMMEERERDAETTKKKMKKKKKNAEPCSSQC